MPTNSVGDRYVELHAHSGFSFLDGASNPDELAIRAAQLGYPAFGLTDHDSVAGAMEFAHTCKSVGIKPIHGAEITVKEHDGTPHHLTLLVEQASGWRNLCRLLTHSHQKTIRDRKRDRECDPFVTIDEVCEHNEGLLCLSGCATHGIRDHTTLQKLCDAFTTNRFWIELQIPLLHGDRNRNRALQRIATRLGAKCVATGNVHAHSRKRAYLQDVFVAMTFRTTIDQCEPRRRGNPSHVVATPQRMASRFREYPDAVSESNQIAQRINFDLTNGVGYRYPGSENPEAIRSLSAICHNVFPERYPSSHHLHSRAQAQLENELSIIDGLGLAGFFVLHHDLLELAREVAVDIRGDKTACALLPPGRGRGSSVASIVCYLTGLSHIDPIKNNLSFERFLHDGITSLPDIDLDFSRDIRHRLIPRIHERYGKDRSALVAAFPTFKTRSAIREIGTALGLPLPHLSRMTKVAESSHPTHLREVASELGISCKNRSRWWWLTELCGEARGLPRHASQHPGGMIISTQPLVDCCPVMPASMENRQLVQWDKDSCADAGFLKIDLLGLGMLSCVERCVELISEHRDIEVDLSRIPMDDEKTYKAITKADTTGVFQIESRAQMGSLVRTKPESFEELTIQVALVRPGPIVGNAVNPYIQHRTWERENAGITISYLHPSLEPVLQSTLGTVIFQDQVIQIAQVFAGFTPSQAEGLRRAMTRKRSAQSLEQYKTAFLEGATRKYPDVTEEIAQHVFSMIVGFSGYGFPKAHAAAFALLAYQSAWLRVHYPAEFVCALLNEQPMGFYPPDALVHDAQRNGITVRSPHINDSAARCTVVNSRTVQIGLGYIKHLSKDQTEHLITIRTSDGPFRSLADIHARTNLSPSSLTHLAWSGACDTLTGNQRRDALWILGVTNKHQKRDNQQLAFPLTVNAPPLPDMTSWETVLANYETTEMSIHQHPLHVLRGSLPDHYTTTNALSRVQENTVVTVAGLVLARQRPETAKGTTFILLEDEHGTTNLIIQPARYAENRHTIRTSKLIVVRGILQHTTPERTHTNIVVRSITTLRQPDHHESNADVVSLPANTPDPQEILAHAPRVLSFSQGRQ